MYPDDQLLVKDLSLPSKAKISLLGTDAKITWRQQEGNVVIDVPRLNPSKTPCSFAWTFKIAR